jgi:hypothetical protein
MTRALEETNRRMLRAQEELTIATDLLHAGHFSAADLEANRVGRMTVGQRLKVLHGSLAVAFLAGIGLVIGAAIGPNLIDAFREDVLIGVVASLFFLMCFLMGVGCAIAAFADMVDVVAGRALTAYGLFKLHTEQLTTNALARPIPSSYRYPGQFTYHLEVADHAYTIGRALYQALSREQGPLRVYYSARSDMLLSLESQETAPAA